MMVLRTRIHTSDNVDALGDKEGVVTHLVLLAVRIVVGVIRTGFDIDLKDHVTVFLGVGLSGSDDIVERVTGTVERIQNTRTHLAVHVRRIVIELVILQCTRRLGIDEVGVHHVQTAHHVFLVHVDGIVLIDRTRAYLDHIVILGDQRIRRPRETALRSVGVPFGSAHAGYIDRIQGRIFLHRLVPLRIGHTGARQGRGHLDRVIEDRVERIIPVPTHTLGLTRRQLHVTLTFQTAALHRAEVERIFGIGVRTGEQT